MAKKAAAKKRSTATRSAQERKRQFAGRKGVDFKPLHDAMDAALADLMTHKKSLKRDALILQLKFVRGLKFCPKLGMFAELE